jgi:hypothetical protein
MAVFVVVFVDMFPADAATLYGIVSQAIKHTMERRHDTNPHHPYLR